MAESKIYFYWQVYSSFYDDIFMVLTHFQFPGTILWVQISYQFKVTRGKNVDTFFTRKLNIYPVNFDKWIYINSVINKPYKLIKNENDLVDQTSICIIQGYE